VRCQMIRFSLILFLLFCSSPLRAQERITFLYPSAASSWAIPMVAKEAKYFEQEGLSVELVRVGREHKDRGRFDGREWGSSSTHRKRRSSRIR